MKAFNLIFSLVIAILAAVFILANLITAQISTNTSREYRVEIKRAAEDIENFGSADLEKYPSIISVEKTDNISDEFLQGTDSDYVLRKINGEYYRFDYVNNSANSNYTRTLNVSLGIMSLIIIGVMLFVKFRIIAPFERIKNVPYELSLGNLSVPVKESRNRFFGKFVWGVNMLKEHLEDSQNRELKLQRDKKLLLLSLSHDIKTPLSAIKLYTNAIIKDLYKDENKQKEIAHSINNKADEIEEYVNRIINASREDFLNLQVENTEFYLSEPINKIINYYTDKLKLVRTEFNVGKYSNCLLKGDPDRIAEVLQNVMENAVKYGDGRAIKITFCEEEDCQLITVSNSGCTLPQTEINNIFESFWRGSNAEKIKGSGLGLYICRQLMRKMDGEIFAEIKADIISVTTVIRMA